MVAGMLTFGAGGGSALSDSPGAPALPVRDGGTVVAGVPVSGVAGPRGSGPLRVAGSEGGAGTWFTSVESFLTSDSSWRNRSSIWAWCPLRPPEGIRGGRWRRGGGLGQGRNWGTEYVHAPARSGPRIHVPKQRRSIDLSPKI